MDFIILKAFAAFIEAIPGCSWLNLSSSLAQFSATIGAQTRLDIEGKHLILMNRNFKHVKHTKFPRPLVMSPSVLVESFEKGICVSEYTDLYSSSGRGKSQPLSLELAHFIQTKGEDLYLKMLLIDNLMHADLHPGNIIIQQVPKEQCRGKVNCEDTKRIVLVDAGMVAVLTREEQNNFIGLLAALGRGDGREAASFVLRFSERSDYSKEQQEEFKASMVALFEKVCRGYGTNVDVGTTLRGILGLIR